MPIFNWDTYDDLLESYKFKEADYYRLTCMPECLYKFYSLNDCKCVNASKLKVIENDMISLASVKGLNDPFEFKAFQVDCQAFHEYGISDRVIEDMVHMIGFFSERFYISSFVTSMHDNMPMWAYYTNNHRGFCLQYKVTDRQFIHKVEYVERPIVTSNIIGNIFCGISRMIEEGREPSNDCILYIAVLKRLMQMKHMSWAHEDEYRLIYPTPEKYTNSRYDVGNSKAGLQIEKIVIGYSCEEKYRDWLISIARELKIEISQTVTADGAYMLEERLF